MGGYIYINRAKVGAAKAGAVEKKEILAIIVDRQIRTGEGDSYGLVRLQQK